MKTYKKFALRVLAIFLVLSLAIFMLSSIAFAEIISEEKVAEVLSSETIDDDLFIAAEEVTIAGTVNGDVYAAGGVVDISGTVNGDVYASGGQLSITGTIADDLVLVGGDVSIKGATIGDSLTFGSGNARVDDNTSIGGGILFGTGMLDMAGTVGRGIMGGAGTLNISGSVEKNVFVGVEELRLESSASIGEDLTYYSKKESDVDEGLVVGTVEYFESGVSKKGDKRSRGLDFRWFAVASFFATLILGFVLMYFFPKQITTSSEKLVDHPVLSFFTGLGVLVLAPVLGVLLAISLLGLPLAGLLFLLYVLNLFVVKVFIGAFFGDSLAAIFKAKKPNPYLMFILGLLVFYVLKMIPVVGVFIVILSSLFVFGSMMLMEKDLIEKFRAGKI